MRTSIYSVCCAHFFACPRCFPLTALLFIRLTASAWPHAFIDVQIPSCTCHWRTESNFDGRAVAAGRLTRATPSLSSSSELLPLMTSFTVGASGVAFMSLPPAQCSDTGNGPNSKAAKRASGSPARERTSSLVDLPGSSQAPAAESDGVAAGSGTHAAQSRGFALPADCIDFGTRSLAAAGITVKSVYVSSREDGDVACIAVDVPAQFRVSDCNPVQKLHECSTATGGWSPTGLPTLQRDRRSVMFREGACAVFLIRSDLRVRSRRFSRCELSRSASTGCPNLTTIQKTRVQPVPAC